MHATTSRFRGVGIFVTILFLQKAKVLSGIPLNIWKYNVRSIRFERKCCISIKSGLEHNYHCFW